MYSSLCRCFCPSTLRVRFRVLVSLRELELRSLPHAVSLRSNRIDLIGTVPFGRASAAAPDTDVTKVTSLPTLTPLANSFRVAVLAT